MYGIKAATLASSPILHRRKGGLKRQRVMQWGAWKGHGLISSQRPDIYVMLDQLNWNWNIAWMLLLSLKTEWTITSQCETLLSHCLDTNPLTPLPTQTFCLFMLPHWWGILQTPHPSLPSSLVFCFFWVSWLVDSSSTKLY